MRQKEGLMKIARFLGAVLVVSLTAFPETKNLGMGAYTSESGAILLLVDSALVARTLDNPYVMFYAFMACKDINQKITVAAKDIVVVYKGKEYSLPSGKELREKHKGMLRHLRLYANMGKEGVEASWIQAYKFPSRAHYFNERESNPTIPALAEWSMYGLYGFSMPLFIENIGFAKGDTVIFKVRDAKNPELNGEVEVVL